MLELYNTTNDVKRIPKYKYNGKYAIPPHGSVRIEDEQAYFFKPYARVGIVIRKPLEAKPIEEIKKVEEPVIEEPIVEEVVEEVTPEVVGVQSEDDGMEEIVIDSNDAEDTFEEMEEVGSFTFGTDEIEEIADALEAEPIEEEVKEVEEVEEEPKEESLGMSPVAAEEIKEERGLTAEDLDDMNINELRKVAKMMNIDIYGIRKKEAIRKKIKENL